MDAVIAEYVAQRDADLMLCESAGVAYQADMAAGRVAYGPEYHVKVAAYEGSAIAEAVNRGRCALLARHLQAGAKVLDVGAGSGAFVREACRRGFRARGFDVMPQAVERLHRAGLYGDDPAEFEGVCFWDVLEHMEDPAPWLRSVRPGAYAFASVPVFDDLRRIRASKHYRPGEHLYYFTATGFVRWMAAYGLQLVEASAHETAAGRESIGAFCFQRYD